MTLNGRAQRAIFAAFFALCGAVYLAAWLAPAVGLFHDDAVYLVTAKAIASGHGYTIASLPQPIPETKYPPLFAAILALFTLVSDNAQWLKLLPLACTAGWLVVTFRLLRKTGASTNEGLLLVLITAFSPMVIFLGTNLLSEMLFALLITAALLMLIEDHALAAGMLAGLATLTRSAGVAMVVAGVLILATRRRFRRAIIFAAAAMVLIAPWFGWSLAHVGGDAYYSSTNYASFNILTALPASDKIVVFTRNVVFLLESPFLLLTGITSMYAVVGTLILLSWCLYRRRQMAPDLFVALYCLMLLCWTWPPERFVAPVLPLILWMFWRLLGRVRIREAVVAAVIILGAFVFRADAVRLGTERSAGTFPVAETAGDEWPPMQKLFSYIRANTPPDAILLANLDPVMYLNTGRHAVRGFAPDGFDLFYAARRSGITPDMLSTAIDRGRVSYVVVSPDRDFAESPSFHNSVEALERGGVLEPVPVPGLGRSDRDYRLFRVGRR